MALAMAAPAAGWHGRLHWPQKAVVAEDARVAVGCVPAHLRELWSCCGMFQAAGESKHRHSSDTKVYKRFAPLYLLPAGASQSFAARS